MNKNKHVIYRHIKTDFKKLAGYIDFITNLIYDDLIYTENLDIKYIKISIIFFDKNEEIVPNYFFAKDRINKLSQRSYQEHISKKIADFLAQKVDINNLTKFEASIMYTL